MPFAYLIIMKKHEKQGSRLDFIREKYVLPKAALKKFSWESFAVSTISCCTPEHIKQLLLTWGIRILVSFCYLFFLPTE